MPDRVRPGVDGPASAALLKAGRFFTRWDETDDGRAVFREGGREGDVFYRDRWSHDKVVRSTHGVNCTGSCSWKVYVKDGIITWETQQTDYPSVGPDRPEYEPRGCPRGAAFSWYTYSPTRVRYPYVRGVLLEMYREAKAAAAVTRCWPGPRSRATRRSGGATSRPAARAGWSASSWGEAIEIAAAAHVHTIKTYGPDRVRRLLPDPGDVDGVALRRHPFHPADRRRHDVASTTGTPTCPWPARRSSATRPTCPSPGDWWDATYLMMWGSNVPVTRTPGRALDGRGPLPRHQGRHGQPGLRRQHEVRRRVAAGPGRHRRGAGHGDGPRDPQGVLRATAQVPFFSDYVRTYTDLPFLIRPQEHRRRTGAFRAGQVPHRRRPRADARPAAEDALEDRAARRGDRASRSCPTGPWGSATPSPARAGGTSTSKGSTRR